MLPGNLLSSESIALPQRSTDRAKALSKACTKLDWIYCSFDWEAGKLSDQSDAVIGHRKKRAHRTGTLGEADSFDLYNILKPYINFDLALASQSRKASLSWISDARIVHTALLHQQLGLSKNGEYSPNANFYRTMGFCWISSTPVIFQQTQIYVFTSCSGQWVYHRTGRQTPWRQSASQNLLKLGKCDGR